MAVREGSLDIMNALYAKGCQTLVTALLNQTDQNGMTIIHDVVNGRNNKYFSEAVRQLLEWGGNRAFELLRKQAKDDEQTPLHGLANRDDGGVLTELLLMKDASLSLLTDYQGNTPLHTAIGNRGFQAMNKLLNIKSPDILQKVLLTQNNKGETVLHLAVQKANFQHDSNSDRLLRLLRCAEQQKQIQNLLSIKDKQGMTPWMVACSHGYDNVPVALAKYRCCSVCVNLQAFLTRAWLWYSFESQRQRQKTCSAHAAVFFGLCGIALIIAGLVTDGWRENTYEDTLRPGSQTLKCKKAELFGLKHRVEA
mmetsp:Transcript_17386/g.41796  ORF Transcript_17386/g.41796 Transcript_17386/m.41796 type:complete len:309 (+) Transcript_17386:865-1791(+)